MKLNAELPGRSSLFWLWVGALLLAASCGRVPEPNASTNSLPGAETNRQIFQVKGLIVSVSPGGKQVEIKHEEVPGYMPAMTMPFDVKDTNELKGLQPGQAVSFRLTVAETDAWIDQIRPFAGAATNGPPEGASVRVVRDVQPLSLGDSLPDYTFTNQFGEAFHTSDFKGQALAITFLFTRCPYPTFCPRMASNFEEAEQKLAARKGGVRSWHLLTISFDPEFDQPAVLKRYAEAHHYDPQDWTFATGSLLEVTAIGEQFGLAFYHDQSGSISHNLRTTVIDATGRVQKIFEGNEWTTDELVSEMRRAASKKP